LIINSAMDTSSFSASSINSFKLVKDIIFPSFHKVFTFLVNNPSNYVAENEKCMITKLFALYIIRLYSP
jgi:hypothetical protein